jgi:hypothetical protein
MAKYKRSDDGQDEMTYSQELAKSQTTADDGPEPTDVEDATYKKRYGDLRRHSQTLLSQKDQEMDKLKVQLDQAAKGQIKFPKTDAEIDAWSARYPDVAKIVDTIARKRANEALEEGEKRLGNLKQLESKLSRKEAEQELMRLHPDFGEIRQDAKFHEWVALQPLYIQDALYKNNTDAVAAARAIDLYKADKGKKRSDPKGAATSVGRTSSSQPTTGGQAKWTESAVDRMSDTEYDKNEASILEALRTGKFVYDLTGGAR